DNRRSDVAAVDVAQRLRGEDDASVFLAQRLQPLAQLAGETVVVQGKPALVDDEQRRPPVEPVADAMEEVGQDGGGSAGPDKTLDLERLHVGTAEMLGLGVEQPTIGAADAKRSKRPLQIVGLEP